MDLIKAGWKKYRLYNFTGRVTGLGKSLARYTFQPHSDEHRPAIVVETTVKTPDHIFLVSSQGTERSVKLDGFDMACRDEHELTIIWAIKKGEQRGPYIIVLNNTTKQAFFSKTEILKMFSMPPFFYLLVIPGHMLAGYFLFQQVFITICIILPALAMAWYVDIKVSKAAAKRFMLRFNPSRRRGLTKHDHEK